MKTPTLTIRSQRIQIKFQSTADATRFLRAVEVYCPNAPAAQVKPAIAAPALIPSLLQASKSTTSHSSVRGSSLVPPSPSPPLPQQKVLPPSFATLFPNLTAVKKRLAQPEVEPEPVESASRTLVSLSDEELERVIFQVLAEDGLEELVEKVKLVVCRQEATVGGEGRN